MARFLGVKVWELDDVPDHYKAEAIVILQAREGAARELISKMAGVMPAFNVETLLGEF